MTAPSSQPTAVPAASPRPNHWLPATIFAVTLVVASVLLFTRVPTTTIEFNGSFSGIGFVSAVEQPLNRPLDVTAIGVAGLKGVRLPEEVVHEEGGIPAVRIAVDSAKDGKRGSIVVDRIVVPAGTHVWLSRTDLPRQYRLSLRSAAPAPVTLHADVMGTVSIAPGNAPPLTTTLRAPRPVDFTGTTSALDLDLTLAPTAGAPRWQQIEARDLQLYRVENDQDADRPLVRPVSTVLSGSVFFESVGGTERKLRPGEMLRFGGASGTFLTLDLRDDGIAATFQGDVRELRAGAGDHPRSLMPTMLDWLRQRQGLSLLWGTALYMFGVVTTFRKWWRKPE
ncbi:MAG TPA: hypothetical protein VFW03_11805 [Gemmatimonadaceae bacterium]|nr:hypothetical protein [Gemmatimonadaceae bacterium]